MRPSTVRWTLPTASCPHQVRRPLCRSELHPHLSAAPRNGWSKARAAYCRSDSHSPRDRQYSESRAPCRSFVCRCGGSLTVTCDRRAPQKQNSVRESGLEVRSYREPTSRPCRACSTSSPRRSSSRATSRTQPMDKRRPRLPSERPPPRTQPHPKPRSAPKRIPPRFCTHQKNNSLNTTPYRSAKRQVPFALAS